MTATMTRAKAPFAYGAWSAVAWARYGQVDPGRHPRDELLDRFLPDPEVDEYHQVEVRASAAVTLAAAKETDLQASQSPERSSGCGRSRRCFGVSRSGRRGPGASSPRRWAWGGACWPRSRTGRS